MVNESRIGSRAPEARVRQLYEEISSIAKRFRMASDESKDVAVAVFDADPGISGSERQMVALVSDQIRGESQLIHIRGQIITVDTLRRNDIHKRRYYVLRHKTIEPIFPTNSVSTSTELETIMPRLLNIVEAKLIQQGGSAKAPDAISKLNNRRNSSVSGSHRR